MKDLHAYVTGTIDRALASAGLTGPTCESPRRPASRGNVRTIIADALAAAGLAAQGAPAPCAPPVVPGSRDRLPDTAAPRVAADAPQPTSVGITVRRRFGNASGAREYALYIPAGRDPACETPLPLVLMLHGCTQDADDFARGTAMNALADAHGVLVAYPEQPQRDNGSRCWNWFRRQDQQRDSGEASILAGIVGHVAADHRVDPGRIYVAGLSAGAAMAVILGRTHPDLFAAVGAHSGLPFGAAHDMPGAFRAMHGQSQRASRAAATPMPTIVFHGSADRTVDPRNGQAIVDDALAGRTLQALRDEKSAPHRVTRHVDARGVSHVEYWELQNAGHAWSGGDASGSHVAPHGPDASAQMLRFFLQHAHAAGR